MSDEFELEDIIIEGYCMSCRQTVEMESPQAVWTRKGQPASRGICPMCGGTVFRMGKTDLHHESNRPKPVKIGEDGDKRTAPKLTRDTVYLNYAPSDEALAQRLAEDLEKSGLTIWLHEGDSDVAWSSGVHPALKDCKYMIFVLSPAALETKNVTAAWEFFREKRKPIVIAQVLQAEAPDKIRRSPRFDFGNGDYKTTMRQMLRQIAEI